MTPIDRRLTDAQLDFLREISEQLSGIARPLFDAILNKLNTPDEPTQKKLDLLQALMDNGLEEWEGYAETIDAMEEDEEEEEEEGRGRLR
jgi:hypothetical protein